MSSRDAADAARAAYRRRVSARARRARAETQTIRLERERLHLAHALRRELEQLAKGAADLARTADGQGRAAERARLRLLSRQRRAQETLRRAERFSLELGLVELVPSDREALGLPNA